MTTRRLPDPVILDDVSTSGVVVAGPITYQFPPSDGGTGQVLTTSGTGQLMWTAVAAAERNILTPKDIFGDYTVLDTDNFIRYRGAISGTILLPLSSSIPGRPLLIQNQSTAGAFVTIAAAGSDTIEGDSLLFKLESRFESASMVSDGLGNWLLI